MQKTLAAATIAALAGVSGAANAADLYAPAPASLKDAPIYLASTWAGFYVGANIGATWSNIDIARNDYFNNVSVCETPPPPKPVWPQDWNKGKQGKINSPKPVQPVCGSVGSGTLAGGSLSSTGVLGGVQLGYNFQRGAVVFGLEADLGGLSDNAQGTRVASATSYGPLTGLPGYNQTAAVTVKSDGGFYGDIAGRLGYAWGPALLYAKGGFAWLDTSLNASATVVDSLGNVSAYSHDTSATLTGYTIGGGVEYLLNPNWSIKAEYLHFDFGNPNETWNNFDGTGLNNWKLANSNLTIDTVKLGVNYIVAPGYLPLK